MYPWGISKDQIDSRLMSARSPLQTKEQLLDQRTVVREVTAKNLQEDIERINKNPSYRRYIPISFSSCANYRRSKKHSPVSMQFLIL
jgi:hypothetical protein